jgi:hypothetical protein
MTKQSTKNQWTKELLLRNKQDWQAPGQPD